jgi:serine O-acetyltransferase
VNGPSNPPLLAALRADAAELAKVKGPGRPGPGGTCSGGAGLVGVLDVLTLPGFWAVALWRVGNALHDRGLRPLSRLVYFANLVLFGAALPAGAVVGPGLVMPHPVGVTIAGDVVIGGRCRLMQGVAAGGSGKAGRAGHPVIGDDVWLLHRAAVFGPVTIGDRSVLGAGTMVGQDIAPGMLVLVSKASADLRIRPRTDLDQSGGGCVSKGVGGS